MFIKDSGKTGVSVNDISWLVIFEISGKYKFYMVMKIPDKQMESSGKFKGVMFVDDWFGIGESFYVELGNPNKNKSTISTNGTITMANYECKTIFLTVCTGPNNDYCNTKTEVKCSPVEGEKPPISHLDPDDGSDGQGGGGNGVDPDPELTLEDKLAIELDNNPSFLIDCNLAKKFKDLVNYKAPTLVNNRILSLNKNSSHSLFSDPFYV